MAVELEREWHVDGRNAGQAEDGQKTDIRGVVYL